MPPPPVPDMGQRCPIIEMPVVAGLRLSLTLRLSSLHPSSIHPHQSLGVSIDGILPSGYAARPMLVERHRERESGHAERTLEYRPSDGPPLRFSTDCFVLFIFGILCLVFYVWIISCFDSFLCEFLWYYFYTF